MPEESTSLHPTTSYYCMILYDIVVEHCQVQNMNIERMQNVLEGITH